MSDFDDWDDKIAIHQAWKTKMPKLRDQLWQITGSVSKRIEE
jgi:hypothetical protein